MPLACKTDAAHAHFSGLVTAFTEYIVDMDADGNVLKMRDGKIIAETSHPSFATISCEDCKAVVRRPYPSIVAVHLVPPPATVLLCNFSPGFRPPEMIKLRPVLVVSPTSYNHDTTTVVPISTGAPERGSDRRVVALDGKKYGFLVASGYVKTNMITTVSNERLFRLLDANTKRQLDARHTVIDASDLAAVREAIKVTVGIN